jgi:HEAT repeat protein
MNNDDKYHLALGRFVDAFATAEHNLKFALASTAEVSREAAQALFSNTRVDAAIELIKRLHEANSNDLHKEVIRALSQMKAILTVRNVIMHYGASLEGSQFTTTNSAHVLPKQAKTTRHELIDLENMTADLLVLGYRFVWMTVYKLPNALPEAVQQLDEAASAPMRYKPPQSCSGRSKA